VTISVNNYGAAMTQHASIEGCVQFREGDGINITIRPGACEVAITDLDATISWSDGDTRGSAAIPISDFQRHLATGAIVMGTGNDGAT